MYFISESKTLILYKFRELFAVVLLATLLAGVYRLVLFANSLDWTFVEEKLDIDWELAILLEQIIFIASYSVVLASFFISPFVVFFVAKNDRLTLPIRLLAMTENVIKFFYALTYLFQNYCILAVDFLLREFRCSVHLASVASEIYLYTHIHYNLYDLAQYCQLVISISRFFAVSLDGAYFRYTLEWPLLQLSLPFVFRIGLEGIRLLIHDGNITYALFAYYIIPFPNFLMCALDFMTNRKMKTLKRNGRTSRAESFLMIQMISNSLITLLNTIIVDSIGVIIYIFFDYNIIILFSLMITLSQWLFFNLISGIISVLFLRKPKENARRVTVSTISATTKNK